MDKSEDKHKPDSDQVAREGVSYSTPTLRAYISPKLTGVGAQCGLEWRRAKQRFAYVSWGENPPLT